MKCFEHHDADAIGICKCCGKGVCSSCVTDLGHGLACKNKHESDVENMRKITLRASTLQSVLPRQQRGAFFFCLLIGLALLIGGFFEGSVLISLLGGIFLGFSVFTKAASNSGAARDRVS